MTTTVKRLTDKRINPLRESRPTMHIKTKFVIYIILIFLMVSFGIKNRQPIELNYYFDFLTIKMPLYGLIVVCLLLGTVGGLLIGFATNLSHRKTINSLKQEIRQLKEHNSA